VSSFRIRRLATIASAATLALMLIGPGFASANPPKWVLTVTPLPPTVKAGASAGFFVTIKNNGPSNIATLFLVSDQAADPTYVGTPTQGSCTSTAPFKCTFGALAAAQSVSVTVAYSTAGFASPFGVIFEGNTTGDTISDGDKNTSHGDTLFSDPKITTVALSSSVNFGGGFSPDTGTVANGALGGSNTQQTTVNPPKAGIIATVEDGLVDTTFSCTGALECGNRFGQWSRVNVDNGHNFSSDTPRAFKVTLVLSGSLVPAGTATTDIDVIHVPDTGSPYAIQARCDSTTPIPGNVECVTVTKSGNVYTIVVWLFSNGGLHGTF
jgi:hypothetical protein